MVVITTEIKNAKLQAEYKIPSLPLKMDLESKAVLKKAKDARSALAELKGVTGIIPNQNMLISTLSLQEAKDSSAIENIIATHDELYKSDAYTKQFTSKAAKEVYRYADALRCGHKRVQKTGLLTTNDVLEMHAILEENHAGFRKVSGTALKNDRTGELVYTPPQSPDEIITLMGNLEIFVNDDGLSDADPLVKMAIIHHQFESIHPFYDGNGRTGRIINILYLVRLGLLDSPILYLSRYINEHKNDYYRLLQAVRDHGVWEEWVLFMLQGVEETSRQTIKLIQGMRALMQSYKKKMKNETKIYSQDLINIIFSHPYTKVAFLMREMDIKSRLTASRYLDELVRIGLMRKVRLGRENYYINTQLLELLVNIKSI
jgi:Fic family protein